MNVICKARGRGQGATIHHQGKRTTKRWRGIVDQTKARLAPGSCTVQYKHMDMCTEECQQLKICTQSVQSCSAWLKPVLPTLKSTNSVKVQMHSCKA